MEKKTKAFVIVLSSLLVLCALCSLWFILSPATSVSKIVSVYQNGQLVRRIDLSKVDAPYTITLTGDSGSQNIIEVKKGSLCMLSADCPDKLCVLQGEIGSGGLPIVCLPNNIVIMPDSPADAVTY